jgi:hypothetical protein
VGLYDELLATIRHLPTVALCRLRRAEAVLHVANCQADRRRTRDVARTIIQFRSCALDDPEWRRGMARALFRSLTPALLLSLHRNFRRPN